MRTIGRCLLPWLAVVAVVHPALASNTDEAELLQMSLEELMAVPVHAASGFDQPTAEAPSSVFILMRNDLQNFGYRTLAEALSSVAGLYSSYDRTYRALGVRGFDRPGDYNTRLLVQVNGVRVNDALYSQGRVGLDFPVDLDLIERIEVVRGPSSSLYGSSAFLAVINVVTRQAANLAPAEAAAAAGSYEAFSGRFSLAHQFGDEGSLLLSGSLLSSQGDDLYFPLYDTPEDNNGVAEGLDGEDVGSLFVQGRYGDWTLQVIQMERNKELPTAPYGTIFNDPECDNRDRETMVDLFWAGELAEAWQGLARVGYQRYEYRGDWPYDYAEPGQPPDRVVNEDFAVSEEVAAEGSVSTGIIPGNRITGGAEIRRAFRVDQQYVDSGETVLDSREDQTNLGVYLQDEIRLAPWALASAGLRYDRMEPYGDDNLSPRIALVLTPAARSAIKLIYGEAFRAPNAFERFYDDGEFSMKANPELEPETIRTYEAAWEQRITSRFQLNTAVYRFNARELISQVLDPEDELLVFRNVDAVTALGGEIEARLEMPAGTAFRASYAYCRAEDETTGDHLSNSPEHMLKVNLLAPIGSPRLTAGVEAQYLADRLTPAGGEVEDFVVVNLTLLARRLFWDSDLSLSVYNLFDEDYADPVGEEIEGQTVAQDGRALRVKIVKRF